MTSRPALARPALTRPDLLRLALTPAALALSLVAGCSTQTPPPVPRTTQSTDAPTQPLETTESTGSAESDPAPEPDGTDSTPKAVGTLADRLEVPWGLDFLPDGAAVVTERISGGVLTVTPDGATSRVGSISAAVAQGEAGLLGVAVSPDFTNDRTLFFYLTTDTDNRVLSAQLDGGTDEGRLGDPTVVLDGIPRGFIHDGGRIAFGPDGFLYVSTGETGNPELAQDPDSLAGKILRITADGAPAPGNPDPDSPVWSLGHRNVQGLAWDDRGRLWASEFGDSTWDELNVIEKGGNYGWPRVEGTGGGPGFIDPQVVWPVAEASPSGLAWADGRLWMAGLRGRQLWRIDVSRTGRASKAGAWFTEDYGRLRTVATAPDGRIWLTTSNRDGRGDPAPADDRIILVRP